MVLAIALGEPATVDSIAGAYLGAVNLAEVLTRLHGADGSVYERLNDFLLLLQPIQVFTEQQAIQAATLRPLTRTAGLSLGDRACHALAMDLRADVYTADRAWASLDLPLAIHLIR